MFVYLATMLTWQDVSAGSYESDDGLPNWYDLNIHPSDPEYIDFSLFSDVEGCIKKCTEESTIKELSLKAGINNEFDRDYYLIYIPTSSYLRITNNKFLTFNVYDYNYPSLYYEQEYNSYNHNDMTNGIYVNKGVYLIEVDGYDTPFFVLR